MFTLDAVNDECRIIDYVPERQNCGGGCPTVPLGQCTGVTLVHSLKIQFGPNGTALYTVSDAQSGKQILSYKPKGNMGGESSL